MLVFGEHFKGGGVQILALLAGGSRTLIRYNVGAPLLKGLVYIVKGIYLEPRPAIASPTRWLLLFSVHPIRPAILVHFKCWGRSGLLKGGIPVKEQGKTNVPLV